MLADTAAKCKSSTGWRDLRGPRYCIEGSEQAGHQIRIVLKGVAFWDSIRYNMTMIAKPVAKTTSRTYGALLVCLFVAANSVQGTVLCFGADGHVEYESAFHQHCTDHDHTWLSHGSHSPEAEHDEDKHSHHGSCVDIPFDLGLVKISRSTEQLDRSAATFDAGAVIAVLPSDFFERSPVSGDFLTAGSYFSPLSTIVILA